MRNQRGFTLLEVLIATVILAGGIMVLANSWSGNFIRVRNARINNTMAGLLEQKMTEYEIKTKEKPNEEIPEAEEGDFGAKYPGYRWEMKSQAFELPDMTGALASREGGVDEMTLTIMRTTTEYFKQAVKELQVTVFYKNKRGRDISHSATQYVMDYSKELPMPPGLGGGAPGAPGAPATGGPAAGGGGGTRQ